MSERRIAGARTRAAFAVAPIVSFVLAWALSTSVANATEREEIALGNAQYSFSFSWFDGEIYASNPVFSDTAQVYILRGSFCTRWEDIDRFTFGVETDMQILGFTPAAGVANDGTVMNPDLRFACGQDPFVLGYFDVVGDGTPNEICFLGPMVWYCTGNDPSPALVTHDGCCTACLGPNSKCRERYCSVDYVVPESWSRVRAKYR